MAAPEPFILENTRGIGMVLSEYGQPRGRNGRPTGVGYQWTAVTGANFNEAIQNELERKGARMVVINPDNTYRAYGTLMRFVREPGYRTVIFPNQESQVIDNVIDQFSQQIDAINQRIDKLSARIPAGLPVANPLNNNGGPPDPVARGNNNNGYIPPVAIAPQGGGRRRTRGLKKRGKKTRRH